MKKLILMISFLTGFAVVSSAQVNQRSPDQQATHMTKMLQKRLNLSADQTSQVNAIMLSNATRLDSLKSNMSADMKTNHLTRKTIMLATDQKLYTVLNDDQRKTYTELKEMRKEKHKAQKNGTVQSPQMN